VAVTLVGEEQRREIAALADRLGLEHGLHHGGQGARPGSRPAATKPAHSGGGRRHEPRPGAQAGRPAGVSSAQRRRRRRSNQPGGPSRAA
jgi:hypothetical protein